MGLSAVALLCYELVLHTSQFSTFCFICLVRPGHHMDCCALCHVLAAFMDFVKPLARWKGWRSPFIRSPSATSRSSLYCQYCWKISWKTFPEWQSVKTVLPQGVKNLVSVADYGYRGTCQNPAVALSFVKTVAPESLARVSLMAGRMCLSRRCTCLGGLD